MFVIPAREKAIVKGTTGMTCALNFLRIDATITQWHVHSSVRAPLRLRICQSDRP